MVVIERPIPTKTELPELTPPDEVSIFLEEAADLLAEGWITGDYQYTDAKGKKNYCAIGAMQAVRDSRGGEDYNIMQQAIDRLCGHLDMAGQMGRCNCEECRAAARGSYTESTLISWNDSHDYYDGDGNGPVESLRSKFQAEVVRAFREAAALGN